MRRHGDLSAKAGALFDTKTISWRQTQFVAVQDDFTRRFAGGLAKFVRWIERLGIRLVLVMTYVLLQVPLPWWFRIDTRFDLQNTFVLHTDRLLIVANHQRACDPYVLLATLPWNIFWKLLPIRFFTANVYLSHWWQKVFLKPFGCFYAQSVSGKISGVKGGLLLSDEGNSLFIFPEGKRRRVGEARELKVGVGYLVKHREFVILPVEINYGADRTTVHWKKAFHVPRRKREDDLDSLTKQIFARVAKP